jgi:predicted dehydrogenase
VSLTTTIAHTHDGRPVGDVATIALSFADGSVAAIHYIASGSRAFPKERVECFFDGCTLTIDNWRRLQNWDSALPRLGRGSTQDKGHRDELKAWLRALRTGGPAPIPLDEIIEVSHWVVKTEPSRR